MCWITTIIFLAGSNFPDSVRILSSVICRKENPSTSFSVCSKTENPEEQSLQLCCHHTHAVETSSTLYITTDWLFDYFLTCCGHLYSKSLYVITTVCSEDWTAKVPAWLLKSTTCTLTQKINSPITIVFAAWSLNIANLVPGEHSKILME